MINVMEAVIIKKFSSKKFFSGLYVGEEGYELVKLSHKKGKRILVKYIFDSGDNLKKELKKVKSVNMALKSNDVIIRQLNLPPMPKKEMEKAVYYEGKNNLIISDNSVFDWYNLGQEIDLNDEKKEKILIISAHREVIERYQKIANFLGVYIKSLEVDIFSLYRLARHNELFSEAGDVLNIIINIENESTSFVLTKGKNYLFSRDIAISIKSFEGIINELESTINYLVNQGYSFNNRGNLYFVGTKWLKKELLELLKKDFNFKTVMIEPFKHIELSQDFRKDKIYNACVATGLALKE